MAEHKWRRKAARTGALLAILYLAAIFGLFFWQRRLLYFPDKLPLNLVLAMAARCEFEAWQDGSGQVIGWKQLSKTNGPHNRILITHGNAGSAIDRVDFARGLNGAEDCDVYILEYPGYGARPGAPTQESLFRAADQAMALLEKDGRVYVIGESLGTGVAAYIAAGHPQAVAGLLLLAPYHNLGDVAQHHMPIFPAKWMVRDRFTSAAYLRNYHGPVGVVLAGRDTVVPQQFGQQLYEAYDGPKRLWQIPLATHNDLANRPVEWWKELVAFWKDQAVKIDPPDQRTDSE